MPFFISPLVFPLWSNLVRRIQCGEVSATEELYGLFFTGIRFLMGRQIGTQDLDAKVRDVFSIITQGICNDELREPDLLIEYVHTVFRSQVASHIDRDVQKRRNCDEVNLPEPLPERCSYGEFQPLEPETLAKARRVLQRIPKHHQEALKRFYLNEGSAEKICQDTGITDTQFRLTKSRARALFGELGKHDQARWTKQRLG